MSERRAFIVTEGSYSDYEVYAVFDDEVLATAWRDAYCRCGDVCEFELNPRGGELRVGLRRWRVELWRDGDVQLVQSRDFEGEPGDRWRWGIVNADVCQGRLREVLADLEPTLLFESHLVAPDEATAVKIAGERRARSLAAGEADAVPLADQVMLSYAEALAEVARRGLWTGPWLVRTSYRVFARDLPSREAALAYVERYPDVLHYAWVEPEVRDEEEVP